MTVPAQARSHGVRAFMPTRYRIFVHVARCARKRANQSEMAQRQINALSLAIIQDGQIEVRA